jgi:hypothetical protein
VFSIAHCGQAGIVDMMLFPDRGSPRVISKAASIADARRAARGHEACGHRAAVAQTGNADTGMIAQLVAAAGGGYDAGHFIAHLGEPL